MNRLNAMGSVPVVACLAAMLCLAPAVAFGQTADTSEQTLKALPHDEAFETLGNELGDSVRRSQSDPTIPEILSELDANIAATRKVRELLDSESELTDERVKEISREVGKIAQSFRRIADMAPGVFERRLDEVANIDRVGSRVDFRIADARARMEQLSADNAAIKEMLRNETLPSSEIEKLRLTRQANDAEMHSLEAALAAWSFFAERHDEIRTRIDEQSQDLDVFFHALRENARVYEAASSTLNLANSIREALSDVDSLQNLDVLRSHLVKSWDDLMKIVDEVNDGLLLQSGM